ncbi:hypothetical protein CIB95_15555 [Lottiidibacillus patelloidae]|uniref:RDD domain-containing protein n=1 Tax=Lottiidibacillus patelloidae TaxID=2670334 RepID=A0A263BQX9_9BACI|nr:RDD family protein [Lottiidibacillus patelloidae]OZM55777.1 hypothetical protein CIB95_15555 [Lottiidibacillus patelloidae]
MEIEYGGFWRRFLAAIIDGILISAVSFAVLYFILYWVLPNPDKEVLELIGELMDSTFTLLYSLFLPVIWTGYTVGKKALGVKVQKVTGEDVTFGTMLKRVVLSAIIYGISLGILMLVSLVMLIAREDKRTVHDFIAGTHVIKE